MKKLLAFLSVGFVTLATLAPCHAAIFLVDLSPMGGTALNLGAPATHYSGDHAVGAAAPNEMAMPPSPATGNEILTGISFDSVTKILSFDIGYGSAFGFVDLSSPIVAAHFHAPGPVMFPAVNADGPVIHDIFPFHTPVTPLTGSFSGGVMLSLAEEMALFDNHIYLNIHSATFSGGEIRAQLIPVPEPSTGMLLLLGILAIPLGRRRR